MTQEGEEFDTQKLEHNLLKLARLIQRLDAKGRLLESTPQLLKLMGDMRSQLFEYEVRCTGRLLPKPELPAEVLEAQRIVREAAKRLEEREQE